MTELGGSAKEAEGKKEKRGQFSSNRTNAFQLFAQRNLTKIGVVEFKDCLDRFLASLPDEPKIGGAMPLNAEKSNSTKRLLAEPAALAVMMLYYISSNAAPTFFRF